MFGKKNLKKGRSLPYWMGVSLEYLAQKRGGIELSSGLRAFFVPGRGYKGRTYVRSLDENKPVKFCLAFSSDGLVAWAVRDA